MSELPCAVWWTRSAIVTGAGQGLGEALAHRLAHEGAHVVVADIADDKAQAVAPGDRRSRLACEPFAIHVDVTDVAQCEAMVERTVADVRAARYRGLQRRHPASPGEITEFDPARWRKVIEVNLVGYFQRGQRGRAGHEGADAAA